MCSNKFEIKKSILNKYLTISSFAVAAVASAVPSAVADNTWVGGTSQDWNDAANWGGAFPTGNTFINTATGNYPIISADSSFTPVDVFVGSAATGRLDQTAGTAGTGGGNWFFIGASTGGDGTYNLADTSTSGGTLTNFGEGTGSFTAGRMYIGGGEYNGTGTGVVNINTSGSLTTTTTGPRGVVVGYDGTGTLNLDNGTVSTAGEFWVGAQGGSTGTLNQSGGTINSSSWFVVGFNGTATVNQSGGTINAAQTDGAPTIASQAAGVGTLNVSGGTFNSSGKQMLVGENGTGTLTVSGSGVVNVTDVTNGLKVAANTGSNGTVNLDGGTIQANKVLGGAGTSSTFNFNGGTLQALADNATFVSGLTNVNVKAGGAVIDSNGFDITIGQALLEDPLSTGGGLTKNGTGTLTLAGANSITGATNVNAGTLAFTTSPSSVGSLAVADGAGLSVRASSVGTSALTSTSLTTAGSTSMTFGFNTLNPTAALISTGSLTLNGSIAVSLTGTGALTTNTYKVIDYTGALGGSFSAFTNTAFSFGHSSANLVNNTVDTSIDLNVVADSLVWSGASTSTWTTATTGDNSGPNNWATKNGHAATNFWVNDSVEFNDTYNVGGGDVPVASRAVEITGASVSPSAVTFNNSTGDYVVSSAGGFGIAGAADLIKNGTSKATLTTANTYTGATLINDGTLELGDGTTGHDGSIAGTSGVTNNAALVYNLFGSDTASYGISGTGSLEKKGAGTLTLAGANSYTGTTTISEGVLSISANNNLGSTLAGDAPVTLNGGTLQTTAFVLNTHAITVGAAGGTINVSTNGQYFFDTAETLLGSGALTVTGNGFLTPGVGNLRIAQTNSYSGAVTMTDGGIFEYGTNGAVDAAATFTIGNEGELSVQGNAGTLLPNAVTVTGGTNSVLSFENGGAGEFSGPIALNANVTVGLRDWYNNATVRSGTISGEISGTGSLSVNSGTGTGGVLTLSGANTYSGGTTITSSIIQANNGSALGTGAVSISNTAGAELRLGDGVTVGNALTIDGGGAVSQGILYVPTGDATYSGAITINNAAAAGGHFATGGGTLTLTGAVTSAATPVSVRLGTVVFANAGNSFDTLNINQGTAKVGVAGAIPVGTTVNLGQSGAATLDVGGFNTQVAALNQIANTSSVTNSGLSDATLTTTDTYSYAGIIQDGATNKLAMAVSAGAATLSGANTYTGGTTVSGGSLTVATGGTLGSGNVIVLGTAINLTIQTGVVDAIANTATISLAGGGTVGLADFGYADLGTGINEVVSGLFLNGVAQADGTYGSTSSSATFKNDEFFSGDGIITVAAVPEPGTTALLIGAIGIFGFQYLRRRHRKAATA